MTLTGRQARHLRALGHELKATLQVGKEGVTPPLLKALGQLLDDHELVKVKVGQNSPIERHEAADELAKASKSEVAQVLGNAILLYRPSEEDPTIALPGAPKAAKHAAKKPAKKPAPRPAPKPKKKGKPTAAAAAAGRPARTPAARPRRRRP